jgi:hypothetical protein
MNNNSAAALLVAVLAIVSGTPAHSAEILQPVINATSRMQSRMPTSDATGDDGPRQHR